MAALRLFAEQGYAKTSTRELAEAAGVNVAQIRYYFGDKAGLYRAVFVEPQAGAMDPAEVLHPDLPLTEALRRFYAGFLEPLRHGDLARLCVKLHFREMVEPTGLWNPEDVSDIGPMHAALVARLAGELQAAPDDPDLLRLAICLEGLGVHLHISRDITDRLAPGLFADDASLDRWLERLLAFALVMIETERQRRRAALENR